MVRVFGLLVVLVILWLLLSGHYEVFLVTLGVLSSFFVVMVSWRMRIIDAEGHPMHLTPRAIRYWLWLAWVIGKANVDVARRIVNPKLHIDPCVLRVPTSQRSAVGRATYASSINLTPGTVSLDISDNHIEVHALSTLAAEELQAGEMDRRVTRMEGGG